MGSSSYCTISAPDPNQPQHGSLPGSNPCRDWFGPGKRSRWSWFGGGGGGGGGGGRDYVLTLGREGLGMRL